MATKVANYVFPEKVHSGGANQKYPWNQWLDGDVWCLTQGEDFSCPVGTMRSMALLRARDQRVHVRISIDGDKVYMQKTAAMTVEQIKEVEAHEAELKKKDQDRKAKKRAEEKLNEAKQLVAAAENGSASS